MLRAHHFSKKLAGSMLKVYNIADRIALLVQVGQELQRNNGWLMTGSKGCTHIYSLLDI